MAIGINAAQVAADGTSVATEVWEVRADTNAIAHTIAQQSFSYIADLDTVEVVNAYTKTLRWMHSHTAAQIADKMPAEYYAGDKALYVQALQNQLQIFGDINGDGIPQYVEYTYDPAAGTLSRSITPYPDTVQGPARVLLRNLQPNPGGTDFFQYYPKTDNFGKTYRTEVTVTATTQTESPDPETKQYRTMTSSLVLTARNVLSARDLANNRLTDRIQTMTKTGDTCSWSILPAQFCTP